METCFYPNEKGSFNWENFLFFYKSLVFINHVEVLEILRNLIVFIFTIYSNIQAILFKRLQETGASSSMTLVFHLTHWFS